MQDLVNKHFYNIFIFLLIFGVVLYDIIGFKSADEICALLLLGLFFTNLIRSKDWEINKVFLAVLFIFFFYLCYSLWIGSNTRKAIVVDLIIQLKPYLALFCTYQMMPSFSDSQKNLLKNIALLVWFVVLLPIGIAGLYDEYLIWDIMFHPTSFAAAVTSVSLVYLFCSSYTWKERIIFLVMISIGIASGRSKFYGFFALSLFVILYFGNPNNLRLNLKNVLILMLMVAVIIFVAREKLIFYFAQGITGDVGTDYLARMALYATSFQLFADYFPFGSGLASFGTYASGAYYSDIYTQYGIDGIWGLSKSYTSFVSDTYYPSLAQFGIMGVILYVLFWVYILSKAYSYFKRTRQVQYFLIILLITGCMAIDNIADATFTSNRGLFLMVFTGLLLAAYKRLSKTDNTEATEQQSLTTPE